MEKEQLKPFGINEVAAGIEDEYKELTEQHSDQGMEAAEEFGGLFVTESQGVPFGGEHLLDKTPMLTAHSTRIANKVWQVLSADVKRFEGKVAASQKDHDAMDDLINEIHPLAAEDLDYLKSVDKEEIERMIRSQQSKRSRAKSKQMTFENYKTMLVGAVAENLLRISSGKLKSAGGGAVLGELGFSAEDLFELSQNTEELKKAIRNVQSKISIAKSKADFDPTGIRFLQLKTVEQQLKEVRDKGSRAIDEEAQRTLDAAKEAGGLLDSVDLATLDGEEAKKLLEAMKEMLASK